MNIKSYSFNHANGQSFGLKLKVEAKDEKVEHELYCLAPKLADIGKDGDILTIRVPENSTEDLICSLERKQKQKNGDKSSAIQDFIADLFFDNVNLKDSNPPQRKFKARPFSQYTFSEKKACNKFLQMGYDAAMTDGKQSKLALTKDFTIMGDEGTLSRIFETPYEIKGYVVKNKNSMPLTQKPDEERKLKPQSEYTDEDRKTVGIFASMGADIRPAEDGKYVVMSNLEFPISQTTYALDKIVEVKGSLRVINEGSPFTFKKISFPSLEKVGGSLDLCADKISCKNLKKVGWNATFSNNQNGTCLEVDIPLLEEVGNDITIGSRYNDSNIQLPKLKKVGKDIKLLTTVYGFSKPPVKALPALDELGGIIYID